MGKILVLTLLQTTFKFRGDYLPGNRTNDLGAICTAAG